MPGPPPGAAVLVEGSTEVDRLVCDAGAGVVVGAAVVAGAGADAGGVAELFEVDVLEAGAVDPEVAAPALADLSTPPWWLQAPLPVCVAVVPSLQWGRAAVAVEVALS